MLAGHLTCVNKIKNIFRVLGLKTSREGPYGRHGTDGNRAGKWTRSLHKHGKATNIQWYCILGYVLVPVRDHKEIQPLVAPGKIDLLDHSLERPGHQHAVWHCEKPNFLQALEDCFGDQHFTATYWSQLKRTQRAGESLQDFATAIAQLAHWAYPALPEDHIRREAGKVFA